MRKELWDRQGANIASRKKETILGRDQRFFAVVLSKMDLGNIDTRKL